MRATQRTADEAPPNMTPMIDIVFNLVTFFMLTLDLSHRELSALELPRARHGVEDNAEAFAAERRVTVNLDVAGGATVRGTRFALGSPDPVEADAALRGLTDEISSIARAGERAGTRRSPLIVFVRGDRDVPWRRVQGVLQASADPRVRAATIQFAVEGTKDR